MMYRLVVFHGEMYKQQKVIFVPLDVSYCGFSVVGYVGSTTTNESDRYSAFHGTSTTGTQNYPAGSKLNGFGQS
jgi:hypothetical protein